jgi:hypothetical protein
MLMVCVARLCRARRLTRAAEVRAICIWQRTERTVFVVDPEGLALRRLWCLFEGWMSVVLRGSNSLEVLPHIFASRLSRLERTT